MLLCLLDNCINMFLMTIYSNSQGSDSKTSKQNFLDPAFASGLPLYAVQRQCTQNSTFSVTVDVLGSEIEEGKNI